MAVELALEESDQRVPVSGTARCWLEVSAGARPGWDAQVSLLSLKSAHSNSQGRLEIQGLLQLHSKFKAS